MISPFLWGSPRRRRGNTLFSHMKLTPKPQTVNIDSSCDQNYIQISIQLIISIINQAMVKSQLQNTILRFSREVWKFVYKLNEPARTQLTHYVRAQFEEHKKIPRLKFHQIEYRLRQGRNRFAMVKQCGSIDGIKFKTS